MKRIFALCCAMLCVAGLVGCAQKEDETVVWQTKLAQSGVQAQLSNCTVLSDEAVDYTPDHHDKNWAKLDAVMVDGAPVLTLYDVRETQVNLAFLMQVDTLFCGYNKVYPQGKLDYLLTENEDGSLSYRFDTATPYIVTVTTDSGVDAFALICERSDLQ